jgi:TPR repeat protein
MITRLRISIAFVALVLLGTPWADATAQTTPSEAEFIQQQAEQGDAEAQFHLGLRYSFGYELPQNDVEAAVWYRKAADQGHAVAQFHLGYMYDFGQGVSQDDTQAMAWYSRAADQGHISAQANLAVMYVTGQGVPQNYVESYKWRSVAVSRAVGEAKGTLVEALDSVAQLMTPEQTTEAQRLAREWQAAFDARQE